MIIISGELYVDTDVREEYLAACRTVVEQARTAPGCLGFALSADLVDPERINVYERWASDDDVERFRTSGPAFEQAALIRRGEVRKYRISSVEAP